MKRLAVLTAVVGASLLVALLLAEIALRMMGFSAPVWYRPDPQLGWTLRPGMNAWFTREGRARVTINAEGRRDRETTLNKPDDVYRIVVLGDSYSEAMQVEREQAYWWLLPERLASCGFQAGKRIEVLNFGVSGYGTAQEYVMLESRAIRYRPDLVLLQFTNGNDVRNNSFALEDEKYQPFYVLDRDGRLRIDDSFATSDSFQASLSLSRELARRASDHSRVLQLVRNVREIPVVRKAHAGDNLGVEQGLEPVVLTPPKDRLWQEAWQITEGLIGMTSEYARRNGARFMLFTVPYAIQVHPDRKLREALATKLGVEDLLYPDRRLEQFGTKNGVDVLPLAPVMQRLAEERQVYFHGFSNIGMGRGHWNADGHRAAAELIAQHLCTASEK
jgi:lysophospholipase L1-like esterase